MKYIPLFVILAVFLLISCEEFNDQEQDPSFGNFWAWNVINNKPYRVDAELLFENDICKVWADKDAGVSLSQAQALADKYKNTIYTNMMNAFNSGAVFNHTGTVTIKNPMGFADYLGDGDEKLCILLLDIRDGYKEGDSAFVAGIFGGRKRQATKFRLVRYRPNV